MTPERCRAARQALGWSQERLGRAVGLSPAHVSVFERTGCLPAHGEGFPTWEDELRAVLDQAGGFALAQTHAEQPPPAELPARLTGWRRFGPAGRGRHRVRGR